MSAGTSKSPLQARREKHHHLLPFFQICLDCNQTHLAENTAYIVLSAFDALNPDEPLASYNVEAERLKYVARYLDSGTLLPQEIFIRNASAMHSAACTLQTAI